MVKNQNQRLHPNPRNHLLQNPKSPDLSPNPYFPGLGFLPRTETLLLVIVFFPREPDTMLTCTFEDGSPSTLRHAIVHALVIKDNQILLVRRAQKLLEGGKWAFPGGFVDHNETLEQAVQREVEEESGWEMKIISLISIIDNPKRPNDADRQNIAFNYLCKAIKKTGESDWEVTEQQWFDLDKLPPQPEIAFDHYQVIQTYLKNPDARPEITVISAL